MQEPQVEQEIEVSSMDEIVDGALDSTMEMVDAEDAAEPKKRKAKVPKQITVEALRKKFKSPIQGKQRKVQDWEDRTCARLRAMGFKPVPIGERTVDTCTFELMCGPIRAVIRSEHSNWSSRGLVRFTGPEAPAVTENTPEGGDLTEV